MMIRPRAVLASLALSLALGACGTTFTVPEASETSLTNARAMFAEERNPSTARFGQQLPPRLAVQQYLEVAARVEPVAEQFCRQQTADRPAFNCDVTLLIDDEAPVRNAYQTYINGQPVIAITIPLIADARNPDELAFVMGHEFGHHIGQHIEKGQQQAMAGALILGALTAYGQAQATAANPYRSTWGDQQQMENAMGVGAAVGNAAFSQTYELESDVIGTYIAKAAGYDPVLGARYFARPESPQTPDGARSFWGTHPPDEARLATVIETVGRIEAARASSQAE